MSLDRIHDVNGLMQFSAQPVIGTTGTASTAASNQYPGGYQFGASIGFLAASNSTNGGAQVMPYLPKGSTLSDFQSFSATSGTITHDNSPLVMISVSTTGSAYSLQPASADGQLLTISPQGTGATTGSILASITTTPIGGTTTAAVQVCIASTFTPGAVFQAQRIGQTASTVWPFVWRRVM